MKKPLPETRLTHERIGSKVMRDDPAESREAPAAMTPEHVTLIDYAIDNEGEVDRADKLKEVRANIEAQVSGDSVSVPRSDAAEQWENAVKALTFLQALFGEDGSVKSGNPQYAIGLIRTVAYSLERWLHPERFGLPSAGTRGSNNV